MKKFGVRKLDFSLFCNFHFSAKYHIPTYSIFRKCSCEDGIVS